MSPVVLLVAFAAATSPAGPAPSSQQADAGAPSVPVLVGEVLSDRRFAFCHDPHFPLTADEAKLCPLVRSSDAACPAFAEACKRGTGATELARSRRKELSFPTLGERGGWLLMVMLALAVGGVLFTVFRNVAAARRRPKEEEAEAPPAAAEVVTPREVETDVERLLARARAAAAAGDFVRAITELHAALLRRLEGAGVVTVHPSRTNGDYVRAVAGARPVLVAPVRSFVIDVERVQYGASSPTAELFEALLGRLQALSIDKVLVLVLAAALVFGSGACRPDRGGWEHSPSGRAGVIELLRRGGRQVRERLSPVAKLKGSEVDAIVLLPQAELNDADWEVLRDWVADDGGTLVVAGLVGRRPDWVGGPPADKDGPAVDVISTKRFAKKHGPVELPLPPSPSLRVGSDVRPLLVRGPKGPAYAAESTYQEGTILALADDRLFTNGALPFGDNARTLLLLLADTRRIELVGELTGFVSPNPVASVTRGRLGPFLLQMTVLAALFFLYRGTAFGRLREPPPPRRRSFVEHVEALGEQYARAGAARHALASYGQWVVERLRERMALPPGSGLIDLADAVAVRTGKPVGEVMRLLLEARELPVPTAVGKSEEVSSRLAAARALAELLDARASR